VITNLSGGAHFDVSASGTLAYVPGTTVETERDLVWVSLDGKATPIMSVRGLGRYFGLSPDGTRLVRANSIGPGRDVWVDDLQRLTSTRITGDGSNFNPLWSSDGRSVIFSKGLPVGNLYRRATDNRDQEERLTTSELTHVPSSVSRDGKWLVYTEFNPVTGSDLWILPLGTFGAGAPSGEPQPFIRTNFSEGNAMLSPDGRWVAYQSNESGRFEYYIRSFPDGGQKTQVSIAGATGAQWAPSGREILYRADDGKIMGSAFSVSPDVAIGPPRAILDASSYDNFFCISADGSRVLMIPLIAAERTAVQINVVLNFIDELRQRMH
jgi:Tol biopolymer transport system component